MQKDKITKYLPLVLVLITLVLGISYFHERGVITEVQDEVQSGQAAPEHRSEIPF
jgi:hypothetical protein